MVDHARDRSASTSSRVTVVGAGALGLTFAGALAASGVEVWILVRRGARASLLATGEIVVSGALDARVGLSADPNGARSVTVIEEPDELRSSVMLFCTKGPGLAAATELVRSAPDHVLDTSLFAGFQNGVVKDDLLTSSFGAARVVGASTVLGAQRSAVNSAHVASLGMTYFGELDAGDSPRCSDIRDVFITAGIPSDTVADARQLAWSKFAHAVGIFGVSALTGLATGEIFARRSLVLGYRRLLEEVDAVARAEGVHVADYPNLPVASNLSGSPDEMADRIVASFAPTTGAPSYSSMLQDLLARRATEADQIFGDLIQRGIKHDVVTPTVSFVYDLVRGLDGRNAL